MQAAITQQSLTVNSIVAATNEQLTARLDDEVVILGFQSGLYYGLDGVGLLIWDLLQQPRTVADIRDAVVAEYDVTPEQCERDLLRLLDELAAKQLLRTIT
jgi:Coenzyme PQQ synthesis protein D (PqqD)